MEAKLEGNPRWKHGTPIEVYVNHAHSYTNDGLPDGVRVHFSEIREHKSGFGVVIVTLSFEEARLLANRLSAIIGDVLP